MIRRRLTAVVVMMIVLFTSCGSKIEPAPEEIAGLWMLSGAKHDGVLYSLDELVEFGVETIRSIRFLDAEYVVVAVGVTDDSLLGATEYFFNGINVDIPAAGMTLELDGDRLIYITGDVEQIFIRIAEQVE